MGSVLYTPTKHKKKYPQPFTLRNVVEDLKLHGNYHVSINGQFPQVIDVDKRYNDDLIIIYPALEGGNDNGKLVSTVLSVGLLVASSGLAAPLAGAIGVSTSIASSVILVGGQLLIGGIRSALASDPIQEASGSKPAVSPTYSLSTSNNQSRPYQPLQLVFGKHRVSPDYNAQPYSNFYKFRDRDLGTGNRIFTTEKTLTPLPGSNNAYWVQRTILGESFWVMNYTGANFGTYSDYAILDNSDSDIPKNASNDFSTLEGILVNGDCIVPTINFYFDGTGWWVKYGRLVVNATPPIPLNEPQAWTQISSPNDFRVFAFCMVFNSTNFFCETQTVVKQLYNYGYGDLIFSDDRFGETNLNFYRDVFTRRNLKNATDWKMPVEVSSSNTIDPRYNQSKQFNYLEGNVNVVEGGELEQRGRFLIYNPNTAANSSYLLRKGPEENSTFAIEVDVQGRVFKQDPNTGFEFYTVSIEIEYALIGSSTWDKFDKRLCDNAALMTSIFDIFNNTPSPIRDTVIVEGLPLGNYQVRARIITPFTDDENIVAEVQIGQIRFFQDDPLEYIGENRRAVIVFGNDQTNGQLQRYNEIASAKCYDYDLASDSFIWRETSNPASWFLYFARGGFINSSTTTPTIGWINNFDNPNNGRRLFGCGISDVKIDIDTIKDWHVFCNNNNLEFNAVLDTKRNCFETLSLIASIGRGSVTWAQGKLGVIWEEPNRPVIMTFGMANIIKDSFEVSYLSNDLPDEIIVNYIDPNKNWGQNSVRAQRPGATTFKNVVTVDMWGITNQSQAQREANLLAAKQLYQKRNVSFETDIEGLCITRGDIIQVSHDSVGWDYSGRVKDFTLTGVDLGCELDSTIDTITMRLPNGDLEVLSGSMSGTIFTPSTPISITDLPSFFDGQENTSTSFQNSCSLDYTWLAGVTRSGKKMRVVEVLPTADNIFRISCIDEEDGFYSQEFGNFIPSFDDYNVNVASVKSCLDTVVDGILNLHVDLENSLGWSALVSINGSSAVPMIDVNGVSNFSGLSKFNYTPGDVLVITIFPSVAALPTASIPKTITINV